MVLGDNILVNRIKEGGAEDLVSADGMPVLVNNASVNLRLGNTFLIPRHKTKPIWLGDRVDYHRVEVKEGAFYLKPGQFVLATTIENVNLPVDIAGFVQGRSSIGRVGLSVQNAGYVDPGFNGHITLELKNESQNVIALWPGYPVTQIVFFSAQGVTEPYKGKYNGQIEATGSRMEQDNLNHEHE